MAEYVWVDVSMPEHVLIYNNRQGSEYVSYTHGTRSLYKLMSTYWDRRTQNPIKNLRWSALENLW